MRLTTLEKTDKNTYYRLGKADNGTIKRKIDNRIESDMVFCNDNVSVKGVYADVSQNVHIDKDVIYKLDLQGIS